MVDFTFTCHYDPSIEEGTLKITQGSPSADGTLMPSKITAF
jgi:hypothetical protein